MLPDTFYLKWPIFISAPDEVTFVIDAKGDITEFIDDALGNFKKVLRKCIKLGSRVVSHLPKRGQPPMMT